MGILRETSLLNAKPFETLRILIQTSTGSGGVAIIPMKIYKIGQEIKLGCDGLYNLKYIKKAPGKSLIYEDKGHSQIVGYSDVDVSTKSLGGSRISYIYNKLGEYDLYVPT